MDSSDSELVRRCLDRGAEEYRPLVRRYQAALLAFLASRLGNRADAEDAAQEAFIRAYHFLHHLHKPESFFAYLFGIAGRVSLEYQRTRNRQRKAVEAAANIASESSEPADQHDHDLQRSLAALPKPYQQVILLRYYAGLSCSDIARQLEMPLGSVTKNLSRAYAMLRESLSQSQDAPTTTKTR